ncbi:MAG: winged helix-turn-helix domain-containing protein, partial [Burkholderiales bacterium]|nr:winged helix-turn-helix domain-containing protein [Burkholderiales bacterium]
MTAGAPLKVGTVLVWPASNELDAGRGRERIAPRLMALLIRLVTADGAPVDRTTLIDEVWSRKGVTDEVLSRAIAELRILLGDDAKAPRYIETLPKVGYRLIAAIAPLDEPSLTRTAVPRAPKAGMAGGVLAAAVLATGLAGWALRDA